MALKNNVIVALDGMDKESAFKTIKKLGHHFSFFKIGLELFNTYGPSLIFDIQNKFEISLFLDLKLHDIPKTVSLSIKSLQKCKPHYLTIHLSGGRHMLQEAIKAQQDYLPDCKLLGVSLLTSLSDQDIIDIFSKNSPSSKDIFQSMFQLAKETEVGGVVCSAHEAQLAKSILNSSQDIVCPGVRFQDQQHDDQIRVIDPLKAFELGASKIVIGRGLTKCDDLALQERITYLS